MQLPVTSKRSFLRRADFKPPAPRSRLQAQLGRERPDAAVRTVNGRGSYHFRTRAAAEEHLNGLVAAGIDNVDIGCMQVNWHWHCAAFAPPAAALDPFINADRAAALPALAEAYRCRVARASGRSCSLASAVFFEAQLLGVDEVPDRAIIDLEAARGEFDHQSAQGEVPLSNPISLPSLMLVPDWEVVVELRATFSRMRRLRLGDFWRA